MCASRAAYKNLPETVFPSIFPLPPHHLAASMILFSFLCLVLFQLSPAYSVPSHRDLSADYLTPSSQIPWSEAHAKAKTHLANWTLEQKVSLTTGVGWENGRCVGNIGPVPEQGFTGLCLQDSPSGVRLNDRTSSFPAGINAASTFDKDLMYKRGHAMGMEHRGKGVNVALGPMTNMGRVAAGGRNWEGFGGDPYLSGWATEMTVRGLQDAGVQACVKHYIGNEQERNRTTSSSNIADRTVREIYSHPFLKAVQANVAAVMCSYNLVNSSWACQNNYTMNHILKGDFGFQGYITSDWGAQHSGVLSANTGLDMTMPGDIDLGSGTSYWGSNLTAAVHNGSVSTARLDDMAQRILAAWYLLGQEKNYTSVSFDSFRRLGSNNSHVDVQGDHWKLIKHIGAASTVLLKNLNSALPLSKPRSIALIGSHMGPSSLGPNGYSDRGGLDGTLAMGWGSGSCDFPYLIDPITALSYRARRDHTDLSWMLDDFDLDAANTTAQGAEYAIVGIASDSGEGYITVDGNEGDRNNLTAWKGGDDLVLAVAAVNAKTIVVVHSVGPMLVEKWIDHPNVTAVLWAGIPGQESGNALVEVLYGAYNPSGRLPYTIAKERSDYPADIIYVNASGPAEPQVNYTEGLNIDYRHFLSANLTPRFEFGFGLSYTQFQYGSVAVSEISGGKRGVVVNATDKVGSFLAEWLQKPRWKVSASIKNIGPVDGCEIPQLYLVYPKAAGEPPRVLRDFTRVNLQPNATCTVEFHLSRYDVSIWNVVKQKWTVPEGEYGVVVAKSSMDVGVTATFCPSGKC
ncbi:beta-glucosidase, partial [Tremellales sp. Uapishka_1]